MNFNFFKVPKNKEVPEESKESDFNYWEKMHQEFGLQAKLFANYLKKIGQEKEVNDIINEWQQELINWRSENQIRPIQSIEKDIIDLKNILTAKAEADLLSDSATADSCYYDHLLLLSLGTSELHRNPELQYKKDEEIDKEDILEIIHNDRIKNKFYFEAEKYLKNSDKYNKNKNKYDRNLEKYILDSDAILALNQFPVMDTFYDNKDYYKFKSLPSFVADELIKRKKQSDLYYFSIFNKFESFSDLVARDIFNEGWAEVVSNLLKNFRRFPETDPLWTLEKVLKCSHSVSDKKEYLLSLINTYIKDSKSLKKAYKLMLSRGITIEDEDISNILSEEDRRYYQKDRDQFISNITMVLGDNSDHVHFNNILDMDKFYEMLDNGYAPVLLGRTNYCYVEFDKKILMEKLKKNKQSSYYLNYYRLQAFIDADDLNYYRLQAFIDADDLIKNIIDEGDIDVLAASLGSQNLISIPKNFLIKLWDNGYERAVKNNINRFYNLSDDIAQLFIDSNYHYLIFSKIRNFNLSNEFLRFLIDNYKYSEVFYDMDLRYLEDKGVFDYFLEKIKDSPSILKKLTNKAFLYLQDENKNKFAEVISKTDAFEDFLLYALSNNSLPDIDFQISIENFENVIEKSGKGSNIISFIKNIKNEPEDSFYTKNKDFFSNEDKQDLISFFILLLNKKILSKNQEGLDLILRPDKNLANRLIETGNIDLLISNLEKFKNLDQEIAAKILEVDALNANKIINNLDIFNELDRNFGQGLIKSSNQFSSIVKINDCYKPPLDKMVAKASEIFGAFASSKNFNLIKGIDNNDKSIIKRLKLKKGGNDGLRELQERLSNFKKEIISENFNPEILLQDINESLYLPYFKSYVRYEDAQWGLKDEENLKNLINSYAKYKNSNELKELNPNFKPSQELSVARSDEGAREEYQFNEHFLNRFSVLVNSIKKAKNLFQEKFPLSKLVEEIEGKRKLLISELKEKSNNMPNPQAKEGISRKINLLESVNIRSVKDFQENFSILAKNKEFNELLRQVVFLISFSKNKQSLDFDLDAINLDKPKLDDISWTLDFIDHITNQETMDKYFTDKKSKKMFDEIISAQAISDELVLLQGEGGVSSRVSKIQLIPSKGILMELSGHIADACWASKYDSIAKNFPNFTSVIIRQNPDNKYERLAGALMLIETESKSGERLLVIRGLNPIENLINSLSVKDFYNKTTDYLKELAKNDNRKLAIVIDDHSGGSSTNRRVLFDYLSKLSKELEAVDLKSEDDTTFNGYTITRKTYLLK